MSDGSGGITWGDGPESSGEGDGASFAIDDHTLKMRDGAVYVNVTSDVEADNTLPITSGAVAAAIGNIETILKTI